MSLCIIPARANSKRLPRKNTLPFMESTMLGKVIENCKNSGVFSKIVVSSEDDATLTIAQKSGATPYLRRETLSEDDATVDQVCCDVLSKIDCQAFCCIYATSVLLSADTIASSENEFFRLGPEYCSVLMGVSEYNYPPLQLLVPKPNGCWELLFSEHVSTRSQEFPETRVSNGTFYWAYKKVFLSEKSFYSQKLRVFDVGTDEVSDINTKCDYEQLLKSQQDAEIQDH